MGTTCPRGRKVRARRMPHDQHLVIILGQCLRDLVRELGHPRLKLGRIGPAIARRIGVVVHQIIGKELVVLAAEPFQNERHGKKPRPAGPRVCQRKKPS